MNFWDTSAIMPLLVNEKVSSVARRTYKSHGSMTVWWASSIECSSAICRLERDGKFERSDTAAAFEYLQELEISWRIVQPSEAVKDMAVRLLRVHRLSAADAMQLAAALIGCEQRPKSSDFVCLDKRLLEAASREGFRTVVF